MILSATPEKGERGGGMVIEKEWSKWETERERDGGRGGREMSCVESTYASCLTPSHNSCKECCRHKILNPL